jgi:hypothetical protein
MTDLTVTCFYWQDNQRRRDYSFDPVHILILRDMVDRHLTVPHRFVCVTNEKIDDIDTIPLNKEKHVPGTVFARLYQRSPDYPIKGRILNLDIDMVITGSLDKLVDRDEPSVWWRNPNYSSGGASRAFYQTSVQLFTQGANQELWDDFDPVKTPKWVNRRFGGAEQAWVSERLPWTEPYWDERDGIYGAGRLFHGEPDKGVTTELPDNACIVSFPGNRMPDQPEIQALHPWIKEHYR